jgi:hypothetical protein
VDQGTHRNDTDKKEHAKGHSEQQVLQCKSVKKVLKRLQILIEMVQE